MRDLAKGIAPLWRWNPRGRSAGAKSGRRDSVLAWPALRSADSSAFMAKVDIDLVKFVLQRNELPSRTIAHILEEISQEVAALSEQEAKPPPVKKQFVPLVSDPKGKLAEAGDFAAWVVQIPEEEPPQSAIDRIVKASYAYNLSPKGRRIPVKTIGEACEAVQPKFLKEEQVWVKTKEPVLLVKTDNQIPREAFE